MDPAEHSLNNMSTVLTGRMPKSQETTCRTCPPEWERAKKEVLPGPPVIFIWNGEAEVDDGCAGG